MGTEITEITKDCLGKKARDKTGFRGAIGAVMHYLGGETWVRLDRSINGEKIREEWVPAGRVELAE